MDVGMIHYSEITLMTTVVRPIKTLDADIDFLNNVLFMSPRTVGYSDIHVPFSCQIWVFSSTPMLHVKGDSGQASVLFNSILYSLEIVRLPIVSITEYAIINFHTFHLPTTIGEYVIQFTYTHTCTDMRICKLQKLTSSNVIQGMSLCNCAMYKWTTNIFIYDELKPLIFI